MFNNTFRPCHAIVLLLALIMSSAVTGCVKAPFTGKADAVPIDNYPRIVASRETYKNLRFSAGIVEAGTLDRPMRVSVPVRSTFERSNLNVQYRFEFLDGAGRPMRRSGNAEWRYKALPPRNQVFLDGNALDTGASDWRLEVRLAE